MLKLHWILVLILAGILQLHAQFNPEVRVHLDDALDKLKSGKDIQLHYLVSDVTQKEAEVLSEGTVYMKGEKYKVLSEDFIVFYDGKDQYIYRPDDEEVMIQPLDTTALDENNPVSMLLSYKTGFKFDLKEETGEMMAINMVAQDPYSPYILITVKLNKQKKEFVSLQMLAKDESALRIDLHYETPGEKLNAAFFNFNAQGLTVKETVDLREN